MRFFQSEYFSLTEIVNNPMWHPDTKAMNFMRRERPLFLRNVGFYIFYFTDKVQLIVPWVTCIYANHITR